MVQPTRIFKLTHYPPTTRITEHPVRPGLFPRIFRPGSICSAAGFVRWFAFLRRSRAPSIVQDMPCRAERDDTDLDAPVQPLDERLRQEG